jgi:hypothetical protein
MTGRQEEPPMLLSQRPQVEQLEPLALPSATTPLAAVVPAADQATSRQGPGVIDVAPSPAQDSSLGAAGPGVFGPLLLPVVDDAGDLFETAQHLLLEARTPTRQTGVINHAGDVDVFRFEAPGTGVLLVRPELTDGALTIEVTVFDCEYQQLIRNDTTNGTATFPVVAGESYYVRVTATPVAAPGAATGGYTFSVVPQFLDAGVVNPESPRLVQAEAPPLSPPVAADGIPLGLPGPVADIPGPTTPPLDARFLSAPNQGVTVAPAGGALADPFISGEDYSFFAADAGTRSAQDLSSPWYGLGPDVAPDRGEVPDGTGAADALLDGRALFDSRHPGIAGEGLGQGRLTAELVPLEEMSLARVAALLPADGARTPDDAGAGGVGERAGAPLQAPDPGALPTAPPRHRARTLADLLLPAPLPDRGAETDNPAGQPREQPDAPRCPPRVPEPSLPREGRLHRPGQGGTADRCQDAVLLWFAAALTRASLDKNKNGDTPTDEATRAIRAGQCVHDDPTMEWP